MDLDVSESVSVPAPARHYGTRSSNATRRPAIDIGLDWEASQRERLEQEAEKARKKEQTKAKRRSKAEHRERESKGIEKLAALELARDKADEAERLHVKSTTARGYRKPEVEVEEDGHDGRRSASSVSSGDVYEEPQDPQAPSSLDGNSDADMPDVTPMKTKGQVSNITHFYLVYSFHTRIHRGSQQSSTSRTGKRKSLGASSPKGSIRKTTSVPTLTSTLRCN